jgi:hypothetical protein
MSGLVQSKSIEEVNEQGESHAKVEIGGESEELTFGAQLLKRWQGWRDIRQPQEDQWLVNLRQFYGEYEAAVDAQIKPGRSRTFIGITRMKCMSAYSRLVDIFFPANGKRHWEARPTPIAFTNKEEEQAQPEIANGIPDSPQAVKDEKPEDVASEKMSIKIHDHLVESDYDLLFLEALLEQVVLGTGCLKAASIEIEKEFAWVNTEDGWMFQPIEAEAIKPLVESPSIFDVYPDPAAASRESSIGCFQRHVLNKHEFRKLKKLSGFRKGEIDKYLVLHSKGNHSEECHETERKKLAKQTQQEESHLRYDILEYWGWVDGIDLRDMGVEVSDEDLNNEYMTNVWSVDSTIIKAVLDPSSEESVPYYLFPYEKVSKKVFGKGVPEICADSQEILNAAARRLLDDIAILGPQIEINIDEVEPTAKKTINDIFPFKVHPKTGGDASTPMIRIHNLDSASRELIEVINIFRRFIDEELNLPTVGDGGQETAEGVRDLRQESNIINRSIVKNIDKYAIDPFISKLYMFFMQWSDDEEIKGDMKINARGSSALVKAEAETTQLINLLNISNNPTDNALTKRDNMLRMIADNQGLDEDEVVKTKEEIKEAANDPVKKRIDELGVEKITLENQEISAKIDQLQAEVEKVQAAIIGDQELIELKRIELHGKEIEASGQMRLAEKELDAKIAADKKAATTSSITTTKKKKVAGQKKTTVGTTPTKKSKNDGLKSNNKE